MQAGAPVWYRDPNEAWLPATVVELTSKPATDKQPVAKCSVTLQTDAGTTLQIESAYETGSTSELVDVKLANAFEGGPGQAAKVDDLVSLTMLHEPSILDVLCKRYATDKIYSYCGTILLALNPFQQLKALYSNEMLANYYGAGLLRGKNDNDDMNSGNLPPHVYKIADNAYRSMVQAMSTRAGDGAAVQMRNQSMLISGESGAGKTETTKIAMSYLATVGRSTTAPAPAAAASSSSSSKGKEGAGGGGGDDEDEAGETQQSVEARVLDSNPILEAFGNAKTLRNENSSRFGKFIELQFDRRGHLVGARIQTYLLEKVRLVTQGKGERNYHAFYQLMAGAKDKEKKSWGLDKVGPQDFTYTASSGCYVLKGVDDGANYAETTQAMRTLGLKKEARRGVFGIVAAVLHLGNITFVPGPGQDGGERSSVREECVGSLDTASKLLGVEPKMLTSILTQAKLSIVGETAAVYRTFPPQIASETRDALSKQVYGRLFDWLVSRVNANVRNDEQTRAFIGVLDIFGFESFDTNSFEQLCINFANETLQQHFNAYVFKIEQAEYTREAIAWSAIDFVDNEDVLAMIAAKKPAGLLPLLDETCMMPKGDDATYARKVYEQLKAHARFEATSKHKARDQFIVRHYAGEVVYTATGFCDKNRDTIHTEALEVMSGSSNPIVAACFAPGFGAGKDDDVPAYARDEAAGHTGPTSPGPTTAASSNAMAAAAAANAKLKATVGTQFTNQLRSLMAIIKGTRSHYIRCLKPNAACLPGKTDRVSLVAQLRCGGVLEAVRVSRLGYPVRLPHSAAIVRYRAVAASKLAKIKRAHAAAHKAGHAGGTGAHPHTTIPLTFVDLGDHKLSQGDAGKLKAACADALRVLGAARDQYQVGLTKVFFRKGSYEAVERTRAEEMRACALLIQCHARGWLARKAYRRLKVAILRMQCRVRGWIARRLLLRLRKARAALRLQARGRSFLCRVKYRRFRRAVLRMQARWRGRIDRQKYAEMRKQVSATAIQAQYRGWLRRRSFKRLRHACVSVQCAVRVWVARRQLAQLKKEAKDLSAMKDDYKRIKDGYASMEEEVSKARVELSTASEKISAAEASAQEARLEAQCLQQEVKAIAGEAESLRAQLAQVTSDHESLHSKLQSVESELSSVRSLASERGTELEVAGRARREAEEALKNERESHTLAMRQLEERTQAVASTAAEAAAHAQLGPLLEAARADRERALLDLSQARAERDGLEAEGAKAKREHEAALASLHAELEEARSMLVKERSERGVLQSALSAAQAELAGARHETEEVRGTAESRAAELTAAQGKVTQLELELSAARASLSELQAQCTALQASVDLGADRLKSVQGEASKRLAAAESALAKALAEGNSHATSASDARASLALSEEKYRSADKERQELAGKVAQLEAAIAAGAAGGKAKAVPSQVSTPAPTPAALPGPTSTSGKMGGLPSIVVEVAHEEEEDEEEEGEGEEGGPDAEPSRTPAKAVPVAPPAPAGIAVAPSAAAVPAPVPPQLRTPSAPPHAHAHAPSAPAASTATGMPHGPGRSTPGQLDKPGSAAATGAQMGWLFSRSNSISGGRTPGPHTPTPPTTSTTATTTHTSMASPSQPPSASSSAPVRRTSLAGAALSALLGTKEKEMSASSPAVGDRERHAAELAKILMANSELAATAGPSIVLPKGTTLASVRRTSVVGPKPGSASIGRMDSLSSDALSGMLGTVTVGGKQVDVAAVAKRAGAGTDGMAGEVLREMGKKMMELKVLADSAARELRVTQAARDEAVARLVTMEPALIRAEAEVRRYAAEVGRLRKEADDSAAKLSSLETMAEMASGIKLSLAQRLEAALGEVAELQDQVEALQAQLVQAKAAAGHPVVPPSGQQGAAASLASPTPPPASGGRTQAQAQPPVAALVPAAAIDSPAQVQVDVAPSSFASSKHAIVEHTPSHEAVQVLPTAAAAIAHVQAPVQDAQEVPHPPASHPSNDGHHEDPFAF